MIDFADIGLFEWTMLFIAGVVFVLFLHIYNKTPRIRETPRGFRAMLALLTSWAVVFGGGKPHYGRVTVDDPYIRDAGSYLTNDVVHVSIQKKTDLLPDTTEILVYARQLDSTNVLDWARLTPHLTYADHPHDYSLPNATNYNVMVAAQFSPAPTVHTNGVWSITGFIIPHSGGKMGFKQTRTILLEDAEEKQ
jgi:hypothetical protein